MNDLLETLSEDITLTKRELLLNATSIFMLGITIGLLAARPKRRPPVPPCPPPPMPPYESEQCQKS